MKIKANNIFIRVTCAHKYQLKVAMKWRIERLAEMYTKDWPEGKTYLSHSADVFAMALGITPHHNPKDKRVKVNAK